MSNDNPLTSVNAIEAYSIPSELPMLVTSEVVIYPLMAAPLLLEDERAVKAAQAAIDAGHKVLAIFGELEESDAEEDIRRESLYPVGTAIYIARSAEMPDGRMQVLVQGMARLSLIDVLQSQPHPIARVDKIASEIEHNTELEALARNIFGQFKKAVALAPNVPREVGAALDALSEISHKADFIASQLNVGFEDHQKILTERNLYQRLEAINQFLNREVEILELREKISSEAAGTMEDAQKEYFLRQQLRAIQDELGEGEDIGAEIEELREKIEAAGMSEEAKTEAERELKRMAHARSLCRIHRIAHLSGLARRTPVEQKDKRSTGHCKSRARIECRPPWIGKAQRAHPGVPVRAPIERRHARAYLVTGRTARHGQNITGQIRGTSTQPRICQNVIGRHPRRIGNSRPPPHLHRRTARTHHTGPAARRHKKPRIHAG